jgi:hypothetical protein
MINKSLIPGLKCAKDKTVHRSSGKHLSHDETVKRIVLLAAMLFGLWAEPKIGSAQTPAGTNGCAATLQFFSGMLAPGQPVPAGSADPNFLGVSANFPASHAAVPIGQVPAAWVTSGSPPSSEWIGPPSNPVQPAQSFTYRVTFVVACANASLLGRFAAADNGSVLLNGAATGISTPQQGYSSWTSFTLSNLAVGTNTVDFVVQGGAAVGTPGGLTGLIAEMAIHSQCCPCIVLDCPGEIDVETCDPGAVVSLPIGASSLCGTDVQVLVNPPADTFFPRGTNLVTVTAFDNQQHSNTCAFNVVVLPSQTRPQLVMPAPIVVPCLGAGVPGAFVNYKVSALDNCSSNFTLTTRPASGSLFPFGTTIVLCTAMDEAGNATRGQFPVTVLSDCFTNCISIRCPTQITVDAAPLAGVPTNSSTAGAVVNFEFFAANQCGGPLFTSSSPPSGSFFSVGTNTVTCIASDNAGQTNNCTFDVVVNDVTPPQLLVPSVYTVSCNRADGSAAVSFPFAAIDDSGLAPTVTYDPPSGSVFRPGTNIVTATASDGSGNSRLQRFLLVVEPGAKCLYDPAQDPETAQDNWDFELGLTAWVPSGTAFNNQPMIGNAISIQQNTVISSQIRSTIGGDYWSGTTLAIGQKGQAWVGTAIPDNPSAGGDSLTGTLRSKTFIVNQAFVTFLIGGGQDDANLRVEFLVAGSPGLPGDIVVNGQPYVIVLHETGNGDEALRRAWFNVSQYVGQRAVLRIVDNSTTGHLNVDDFEFQPASPVDTSISLGTNRFASVTLLKPGTYIDWNAPLWGFADMHAHPASYLGFGGRVMHGQIDGDPTNALNDCNCDHGGWGLDNTCGDYFRQLFMGVMDDKGNSPHREGYSSDPYKSFRNWPVFTTISHQQMWYDWMRRSYNGGLRVVVALCVNNPLLSAASKGYLPAHDKDVSTLQIDELKDFVANHSDFMEIAYDPVQLRQIVRSNRLAIIIGSELDDIGDLCEDPNVNAYVPDDYSRQAVRTEIQRLYDLGVRYMFTVHLMNNKFGGTAIGSMMLNVGNKYLNGVPFQVDPAPGTNSNNLWLPADFDYTAQVIGLSTAIVLGPVLVALVAPLSDVLLGAFPVVPPGSGLAIGAALMPVMIIGSALAPVAFAAIVAGGIPVSIMPIGGNYPAYPQSGAYPNGTMNHMGLTPLGQYAMRQMMARGMMLDIDHMGINTIEPALAMAESVSGGYPLNSGHNSFHDLAFEWSENSRTGVQLDRIHKLGGLMGIGWENTQTKAFSDVIPNPQYSSSQVANSCAGTSRTFAQFYLYALEKMQRHGVAFGTDMDGLIVVPGPRFGPQSAFGILDDQENSWPPLRYSQVASQLATASTASFYRPPTGVRYTPLHGGPLTDAAFVGKAVDPDNDTDQPAQTSKGYAYNQDQRDFFAALKIFYYSNTASEDLLKTIESALSDNYPNKRRIKEYAFGLVKGITGADPGSDILSGDTETREEIGKAVCRNKLFAEAPPQDIQNDATKLFRYHQQSKVWDDYQSIFGPNTPLTRCQTLDKDWDINFEGVAHYGLLPDFIQDLKNVGMRDKDLDVLFQSAEHFAQMWEHCLTASAALNPLVHILTVPKFNGIALTMSWQGTSADVLQQSADLGNTTSWKPFTGNITLSNGVFSAQALITPGTSETFYRVQQSGN